MPEQINPKFMVVISRGIEPGFTGGNGIGILFLTFILQQCLKFMQWEVFMYNM